MYLKPEIRNPFLDWNPSSTDKEYGVQNPRLSWIQIHGATYKFEGDVEEPRLLFEE